jgi:pimeloyl-ACP methyl ester carboxylesterase
MVTGVAAGTRPVEVDAAPTAADDVQDDVADGRYRRAARLHECREGELMGYAKNALDGGQVYYEDDGGAGDPVVIHGGFGEPVELVRTSPLAQALPADEFRAIYVDHRGHGGSDKPHDPAAYAMPLRVADAVAVLDDLGVERSHFLGISWGGRLGFGIGEHAPKRVLSLVIGGQQPYAWPDSPLVQAVTEGLAAAREQGRIEAFLETLERFWDITVPAPRRERLLTNDPIALEAAWQAALAEGPVSDDPGAWRIPCLIFLGAGDLDFLEQARRAADEIPDAEFLSLAGRDHYGAHTSADALVLEAVLRTLRRAH